MVVNVVVVGGSVVALSVVIVATVANRVCLALLAVVASVAVVIGAVVGSVVVAIGAVVFGSVVVGIEEAAVASVAVVITGASEGVGIVEAVLESVTVYFGPVVVAPVATVTVTILNRDVVCAVAFLIGVVGVERRTLFTFLVVLLTAFTGAVVVKDKTVTVGVVLGVGLLLGAVVDGAAVETLDVEVIPFVAGAAVDPGAVVNIPEGTVIV